MAIFSILALKNRVTERIHGNRARVITGVDLQEILHDIIDSLIGAGGEVVPVSDPVSQISDYGLTGAVNGTNKLFLTSHDFVELTPHVFLNGVRQFRGEDYTEQGGNQIIFATAPYTNDKIIVDYSYLTT
ncbi:MAG: hypothetical protein WC699_18405 [Bacteroidales bacterium]|jgi:hypothetical protein